MAHLQLTMKAGAHLPAEEELIKLREQIIALPIPDGASEIILTQKQAGGHVDVIKILISTRKS